MAAFNIAAIREFELRFDAVGCDLQYLLKVLPVAKAATPADQGDKLVEVHALLDAGYHLGECVTSRRRGMHQVSHSMRKSGSRRAADCWWHGLGSRHFASLVRAAS